MRTRSSLVVILAMAALAPSDGARAAPAVAPTPARPVDAAKLFTGQWVEIGRRPMKLTDGCVAGGTHYTRRSATEIDVLDTCHEGTPGGKLKSIGGPAKILDPGTNTKLHVAYRFLGFLPVSRDYWILDHDDAYSWFISADPKFKDLWIYTRLTHPGPALIKSLVAKAGAMGYDVSQLEFPAQP